METLHTLLLQAIEGETAAEERYRAFAQKARLEGYAGVAVLLVAISRAETLHIANHQRALEKSGYSFGMPESTPPCQPGTTLANLKAAIHDEYEEFTRMYPAFRRRIKKAYGANFTAKIALLSLKWASESEAGHYALLKMAKKHVANGEDIGEDGIYLCRVCGNIEIASVAPGELCKVCGHDPSFYVNIREEI